MNGANSANSANSAEKGLGRTVVRHNHTTRDIKPPYVCPACDRLHGCPCPRGDVALGRLDGIDMGIKRDAVLSHDPTCPIHPYDTRVTPSEGTAPS